MRTSIYTACLLAVVGLSAAYKPAAYRPQHAARRLLAARQSRLQFGLAKLFGENEQELVLPPLPPPPEDVPEGENPAKIPFTELELAEQSAKLDALTAKWRKRQDIIRYDEGQKIGWCIASEQINGRLAMFFLLTGLATEYYTGESMPQQVVTLLQTLSIID